MAQHQRVAAAPTVEERLHALIGPAPPAPATQTRAGVVDFFRPRLDAIGLGGPGRLDQALARGNIVHVAGTKGKGSTCAMLESVLRAAGLRTGLFTSPHMVHPNERIRIDGKPISDQVLEDHFNQVHDALSAKDLVPGYFQFLTLLGFHVFAKSELDVVILEVGLGGRLDCTNVIDRPLACAVTLLDMDHTEYLGDTIELIAAEKAGIFKPQVPVIVASGQEPSALQVLKNTATGLGCDLKVADPLAEGEYELGLRGDFQRTNAGLALALAKAAFPNAITPEAVRLGLASCRWPGRGQIVEIDSNQRLILDGAHTPKSVECAVQWATSEIKTREPRRNILVFNCMHSRNPRPLFEVFANHAKELQFDVVIFTPSLFLKPTTVQMPTAEELLAEESSSDAVSPPRAPEDNTQPQQARPESWQNVLAEVWQRLVPVPSGATDAQEVKVFSSLDAALAEVDDLCASGPTNVFVTGSLLLVGDVMNLKKVPIP